MKVLQTVTVLAVTWACVFVASSGHAELDERQCDEIFRACDLNNDGVISKEELDAVDTNKDGTVTKDEWAKYHYSGTDQGKAGLRLQFYDKNNDGVMNKDEFMEMLRMAGGN